MKVTMTQIDEFNLDKQIDELLSGLSDGFIEWFKPAVKQLIAAYTNKQIEAVLDRLEFSMRGKTIVDTAEGWQKFVKRHVVASIEAEHNKLKGQTNDQL